MRQRGAGTRRWLARQRESNRASAARWDDYALHRARISELLLGAGASGTLVVLGAGNGNDLDLSALGRGFDEIHLVDLDGEALARAAARGRGGAPARIALHPGVDLTGLSPLLAGDGPIDPGALALAAGGRARAAASQVPRADVVLSDCLLSQSLAAIAHLLPNGASMRLLADRVVEAHLDLLVSSLPPGGRALFLSDALSSDELPLDELEGLGEGGGGALRERLLALGRAGRCFPGLDPVPLAARMRRRPGVGEVVLHDPWIWTALPSRSYLVYALELERGGGAGA